jgi:hypothetical protein
VDLPDESHRLRPDHHPTPFSAEQIRDASRPGRETRSLVERDGAEPVIRVIRFLGGDETGGESESWVEAPDGTGRSAPQRGHSTWLELQEHASMPSDRTSIEPDTFETPAGRFAGWRYTRTDDDGVDVFWFAASEPGMPLRYESREGDRVVFRSTVIAIRQA